MKSLIKNNLELIDYDLRNKKQKENNDFIETYFSALTKVIPEATKEEKRKIYQYIYASLKKKRLDLSKIDTVSKIGVLLLELEFR